ncbi:MAG: uroporphyrinogen decarboxylase [Thermoguttaceae bacterium]|nr:uroporphyrinogen decarboxylase [Thermoguttaceae bacterium]
MNGKSLLLRALRLQPNPRPPVWLMRQAGRYMAEYRAVRENVSFLDLCRNPRLCAQTMADAVGVLDVDAAIIFSDILPILVPLGFDLEYTPGGGPVIANPFRGEDDLARIPAALDPDRIGFVFETVSETRRAIPGEKALIGFAGAPWTLASYAVEGGSSRRFIHTKTLMRRNPRLWSALMDRLTDAAAVSLLGQIEAGADAVQIFDSWAGALGPADYETYVFPFMEKLLARLGGRVPVIYFAAGNPALLPAAARLDADAFGIDWRIPIERAWEIIGANRAVQGNLDPTVLLAGQETIFAETDRILNAVGSRPGFIFNLGHGVLKETPVENAVALVRRVKEFAVSSS